MTGCLPGEGANQKPGPTPTNRACWDRGCWAARLLVLWAACPGVAGVTRAEEPTPVFEAARIEQPPGIDGRLSDSCWQKVPPLTNFLQVLPVAGAPPTEDT